MTIFPSMQKSRQQQSRDSRTFHFSEISFSFQMAGFFFRELEIMDLWLVQTRYPRDLQKCIFDAPCGGESLKYTRRFQKIKNLTKLSKFKKKYYTFKKILKNHPKSSPKSDQKSDQIRMPNPH